MGWIAPQHNTFGIHTVDLIFQNNIVMCSYPTSIDSILNKSPGQDSRRYEQVQVQIQQTLECTGAGKINSVYDACNTVAQIKKDHTKLKSMYSKVLQRTGNHLFNNISAVDQVEKERV